LFPREIYERSNKWNPKFVTVEMYTKKMTIKYVKVTMPNADRSWKSYNYNYYFNCIFHQPFLRRLDEPPVAALALTCARAPYYIIIFYYNTLQPGRSLSTRRHSRPTLGRRRRRPLLDVHLARVCRTGPGAADSVLIILWANCRYRPPTAGRQDRQPFRKYHERFS